MQAMKSVSSGQGSLGHLRPGWLAVCGVFASLLVSAGAAAAPIQWTTGSGGNGHWYERIDQTGLTFDAAKNAAASLSYLGLPGRLVIFETATYASELAFVYNNVYAPGVPSNRVYWAGARSPDGNNPWTWVDGSVVPTSITSSWTIDHAEGPGASGIHFGFAPATNLWDYIASNSANLVSGYVAEYAPSAVPEIDPAGIGSVLALVTGALGFLERRRVKAS